MKRNTVNLVNEMISLGKERGILLRTTDDDSYDGRVITIGGNKILNFGSYGYLGLEYHPALKKGAMEAIDKFGIQYASCRTYVSCTLYNEFEGLLEKIFNGHVITANTTSLGHLTVIPVIIEDNDAIILDQRVHATVSEVANKMQLRGNPVYITRHNKLDELEEKVADLQTKYKRVWYMMDGVYSMYGTIPPLKELVELLDRYKSLHLYVDDAHGMSWTGKNGAGYVLSKIDLHPKMILGTSLNKAFAAGGAAFVFADGALKDKVMNCGAPILHAGQHLMSALGAGIACAKIHLSPEIYELQNKLKERIAYCSKKLIEYRLPDISSPETPIFFVATGLSKASYSMVKKMMDDGFYTNLAIFPAVPSNRAGVRFCVTANLTFEDIDRMVERLDYHFDRTLMEEGYSVHEIERAFRREIPIPPAVLERKQPKLHVKRSKFKVEKYKTIKEIPEELWNNLMSKKSSLDWEGIAQMEEIFWNNPKKEENWEFMYYLVKNEKNEIVICTYFTIVWSKDDLFSAAEISKKVEEDRKKDPYYLCSKNFLMGSLVSAGDHLFLDRKNKDWQNAFSEFIDYLGAEMDKNGCTIMSFRDFEESDKELRDYFFDRGFIKVKMPDNHILQDNSWQTPDEFLAKFNSKKRWRLKKEIFDPQELLVIEAKEKCTAKDVDRYYELYLNVMEGSYELNTFTLPKSFFETIAKSPKWDVIEIRLKEAGGKKGKIVAVTFSYINNNSYQALFGGYDYDYVHNYEVYKQAIWQVIKRSKDLNLDWISVGYTATATKKKFNCEVVPMTAYVQTKDEFNQVLLESVSQVPNPK